MANIMEGGKGSQDSSQSSTVTLPDFLPGLGPLLNNVTGMAGDSLQNFFSQLQGGADALVAPFTQAQQRGQQSALDIANGAGDFLPTAQQVFMNAAQGQNPLDYIPGPAGNALSQLASGDRLGLNEFIDPAALQGLQATASGAGLGYDQAAQQATLEQILPQVGSAFGGSVGGLTGLASRGAIGQQLVNRNALDQQQNLNRQLQAQGLLSGLGEGERGRSLEAMLGASRFLGGLGQNERQNQLMSAQALPGMGLLGSDIQRQIGGEQQALEQQRLTSPLMAQGDLLGMLRQFLPIESLLGQDTVGSTDWQSFNLGFPGTA